MVGCSKFEVIENLSAVVQGAVVDRQISGKVEKFAAISFTELGFEVDLVLVIIGGLGAKTCIYIGHKQLSIQRLQGKKEFIYSIRLIVYLLVGYGGFVIAILRKKTGLRSQ